MKRHQTRNSLLALIGLSAIVIYILACTSWSPDDSKVIFPNLTAQSKGLALGLYDRENGTTRDLIQISAPSGEDLPYFASTWLPGGNEVAAVWVTRDDSLLLTICPVSKPGPVRLLALPDLGDAFAAALYPPVVAGPFLLVGGGGLISVNLKSGAIQEREFEDGIYLLAHQDKVYYVAPPGTAAQEEETADEGFEVGTVDPETLKLSLLFKNETELDGEVNFFALSRDGTRMAVGGGEEGSIRIFHANRLEKTLTGGTETDPVTLGNLQWSPDRKTIYTACRKKGTEEPTYTYGILEVSVDEGARRLVPLFRKSETDEAEMPSFQISLSHDGKTIAVASTILGLSGQVAPADMALFLVDLTRPDRQVTKVALACPPWLKEE